MTADVLATILERKRAELRGGDAPLPRRDRPVFSLHAALARPGVRVIMECKRASPSAGPLRQLDSLAPVVDAYDGIADAISVLTDHSHFDGSLDDLAFIAGRVARPVLRKDFILEPRQVREAYAWGADAVLLMLSALDDTEWTQCAREAARLGLDVLTEVHDEDELDRALTLDAAIIGINNRSFHDLLVDLAVTQRLAPLVPDGRLVVCESGIKARADIAALASTVDAFLVGSALMRAERMDLAARELVFGAVKICGLTRPGDAVAAWATGARYGGLVFAPGSPRQVDEDTARTVAAASPLPMVGVFVDETPARITALAASLGLAAVQLHGHEDDAMIRQLRATLPGSCALWKAVRVDATPPEWPDGVDRILFDAREPGSGKRFDWSLLPPPEQMAPHGIAGGLDATNVARAVRTGAGLLDVSSGVEYAPGFKDPDRLDAFFETIREVHA